MALNYHLDRKVRLSDESEYKSLYLWSIQEFADESAKGRPFIPWSWTLNFTATTVAHRLKLSIGARNWFVRPGEAAVKAEDQGFVQQEHIRAELRPGYALEDRRRSTGFSMFGTNRPINDVTLFIYPAQGENKEACSVAGGVSYTSEVDFRNETQPDFLQFNAIVSRERFAALAARVNAGDFHHFMLTVAGVHGFYAEWSPAVSTDLVKVLTKPVDHGLEVADDAAIKPPTLGRIDQFDLHVWIERSLPLATQKRGEDDDVALDHLDDDEPRDLATASQERSAPARLPAALAGLDERLNRSQTVLWIIAGLLLLTLLLR